MTTRADIAAVLYALDESFSSKAWEFERLDEGWTNQSYKISHDGRPQVLRIANQEAHHLGVDRAVEHAALKVGIADGLAPALHAWRFPEGHCLTEFVEGKRWDAYDAVSDDQIDALAQIAHTLRNHSFDEGTDLFQSTNGIFQVIKNRGIEMPDGAAEFKTRLDEIQRFFKQLEFTPVLCHNDINKVNIIEAEQIYVIDWEYAGHGHPLMELARISTLYELSEAQEKHFLKASGISGSDDLKLFHLLKDSVLISDLYWSILRLHMPPIATEIVTALKSDIKEMMPELNRRMAEQ